MNNLVSHSKNEDKLLYHVKCCLDVRTYQAWMESTHS